MVTWSSPMLSMMRRTTVVLPDPDPPATPMTSGAGRRASGWFVVCMWLAYHFITLYVRAHFAMRLLSATGKMWGPPQPVTPCGGRRRALPRSLVGSDSVYPADRLVGGGATHPCACRRAIAHDPRSAVDDRHAVGSNRTAQTRDAYRPGART